MGQQATRTNERHSRPKRALVPHSSRAWLDSEAVRNQLATVENFQRSVAGRTAVLAFFAGAGR